MGSSETSYPFKQRRDWPELARKARYSSATLAVLCGLSLRQLEREFLTRFKQSPEQWINELRLGDSRRLLEAEGCVKIAAMALGYKHPQSFSRAFKRRFGYAPSRICAEMQKAGKC